MLTSHTHTHTLHTYKARTLAFPQVCAQFHMAKEAYSYGKRSLFICQKRPIHVAKETYSYVKRDLFIWQKRPIHMSKEVKRGLFICQKRPIHSSHRYVPNFNFEKQIIYN